MLNLYEYQNKAENPASLEGLEEFLDVVWKNREKTDFYLGGQAGQIEAQQFVQFLHKTKEIKSNKYVGVIHFEGQRINLLPKIFYRADADNSTEAVHAMQHHILWWLSYCRKIKFPNYQTSLGDVKSDFFEILIYLFAKYTRQLLTSSIYQQYEEVNNELPFIKGRLNTNDYINENIARGRWHKLNCTYDAFVLDNKFNRIIKYVANLLFRNTTSSENKKYLREIPFILDEVSDVRATAEECASLQFNPMFGEFETVRDYCYLFLSSSVSFSYKNDLKLFAFLLPMEYVFEDFIFGFIEKEVKEVQAKAQVSSKYLDKEGAFALRPDLLLEIGSRSVIADTKYKIVYTDDKDPKKGISQSDLYQMLAYAVRFKVEEVILFYPNTIQGYQEQVSEVLIEDELAGGKQVKIKAFQLPILNERLLLQEKCKSLELVGMFEETKASLSRSIRSILLSSVFPSTSY
ncbi:McrC family protein [Pontibacter toksunensis]|uniref:McrC family protein n=1 Tax=Pontibacter toksunensis TaxID=1332631 RepID=A0ABW6C082_9BACT